MKRILAALLLLVLVAPAWGQDVNKGRRAIEQADYGTARRELHPLAEQGDADAQYWLALAYHLAGDKSDYSEALTWYRKAAEQGQAEAQLALARSSFRCGGGIEHLGGLCLKGFTQARLDYTEAAKWYRLAAEQGDAEGQLNLGTMYAAGQGVPQDYVLAHKWLNLAAAQFGVVKGRGGTVKDTTATKMRDQVASEMTPEQIAEAQRLAREWMAAFEKRKQK